MALNSPKTETGARG